MAGPDLDRDMSGWRVARDTARLNLLSPVARAFWKVGEGFDWLASKIYYLATVRWP